MTENKHKVSAKQWQKWCPLARAHFNAVYEDITGAGPGCHLPTGLSGWLREEDFRVIAWNAAFTAAHQLNRMSGVTVSLRHFELAAS